MSFETTKKVLLNSLLTVGGSVLGSALANSGKLLLYVKRFGRKLFAWKGNTRVSDKLNENHEDNSLRNLRDYYQRKEGFRK